MLTTDDYVGIYRTLNRIHHLIDGRRWDEFDSVFTQDAVYDLSYRDLPPVEGIDNIVKLMAESFERDYDHLLAHNAMNFDVWEDEDGTVRCHSKVICVFYDGTSQVADMHDVLEKTPDGWRIKVRAASTRDPRAKTWTRKNNDDAAASS
jgi:hypothetical protein